MAKTAEEKAQERAAKKAAEAEAKKVAEADKAAAEAAKAAEDEKAKVDAGKATEGEKEAKAAAKKGEPITIRFLDHQGKQTERTYSREVHGDNYADLAVEFRKTNALRIIP